VMKMIGAYNHKITIQKRKQVPGPLGVTVQWVNMKTLWGLMSTLDTKGRAEYQQLGYSEVSYIAKFPQKIHLELSKHRLIWNGNFYELVAPPLHIGIIGQQKTMVPVRLQEDEINGD